MQLAIIGSKEEIIEVLRYIESMRTVHKSEQVVRAEMIKSTQEKKQLRFDDHPIEHAEDRLNSR